MAGPHDRSASPSRDRSNRSRYSQSLQRRRSHSPSHASGDVRNRVHKNDPQRTLFVGRLAGITTESTLRNFFKQFGSIESLILIMDHITGISKRYAFIEYRHSEDADRAYDEAHGATIDGHKILVDREKGSRGQRRNFNQFGNSFGKRSNNGFYQRNFRMVVYDGKNRSRSHSRSRSRSISPPRRRRY